jgi:hypothetical protein
MSEYRAEHGHFPPAYIADASGRPLHSWRVLLLEYIAPDVFNAYDFKEPWNGPNNRKLADRMPRCYACPNDRDPERTRLTSYIVVVGRATAFPGSKPISEKDIRDDKSQTLLVAEVAGSDIHWMEPRDLSLDGMSFRLNDPSRPSISSHDLTGPGVIFADGSRDRLGESISPTTLKAMVTIDGGDSVNKIQQYLSKS